jgi:uncharacterized protein
MDPLALIRKYYDPDSKAFRRLVGHSAQVAGLAELVAGRLEGLCAVDRTFVGEAAWLHDIGIFLTNAPEIGCFGKSPYLLHGILGAQILNDEGLPRHALVCERHVGVGISRTDITEQELPLPLRDMTPQTIEEEIVAYADLFFSKHRKGARSAEDVRKSLARYGSAKVDIFDAWHARFGERQD